jgi:VCBS repeat-containing protein
MHLLRRVLSAFALLLIATAGVQAQSYTYHVYIDSDLRDTTGCAVAGGGQTFAGADYRLTATVTGTPAVVSGRTLAMCVGGSFGAGTSLSAGYPVGLNNGLALGAGAVADVIEVAVPRNLLAGVQPQVRVGMAAESASGSLDVLYTASGQVVGPPMILGRPQLIPTLGFMGALLLALMLVGVALRTLKRNRALAQMLLLGAFFSAGLAAWAANFIADGQVSDWAGVSPMGSDPAGDPVPPLAATDIVAAFGADEASTFFFRLDVVDVENRPPVANNDAYTTLEDTVLTVPAPGVLGNDSDPDANPILAQLVTGPTQGTLTLNANGSFSYTPNANTNGSDSFSYNAFDGQVPSQTPGTVTITITPVNDVPVFTSGPSQTVLEDAGAQTVNPWASGISDGDPEATQNLTFNVTGNTNPTLFSAGPAISATGALTYTPAANANGTATITLTLSDDGGTAGGGVDTSAPQSFTITVTAVNDAPSFTAGPNQTVNEDAGAQTVTPWATAISPGPADESAQTVSFNITGNTNPALFSAAPAISPTGTLTYTPAANANGVATITLVAIDSGSGAAPSVNTSAPQTFTITVTGINDAPVFTKGPDQTVLEDAGAQTVNPWATGIDDGDPELTQTLSFIITGNTNAALFSAGPSVSPSGVLSYTPAANANGSATITLRIEDNGSNTPPNVNTSATQSFTITVTAVNDAPSFTKGADQTVNEDAGPQTVNPWATAISPGPADEAAQTIAFNVTGNTNAALFSAAPAISPAGVLSYTPAVNASGSATITLVAVDSGSGVAPNVNTSAAQTFVINVTAVNDAPVNTVPGTQNTGDSTPLVLSTANTNAISVADVDAAAGIVQMSFGTGALANGTLTLANPGGVLSSLSGNGTAQVIATGTLTALNAALNGPSGSLTYTPVAGTAATRTITVITNDQGNTGSGGAQIDTDIISVNVDSAPVVSSTPASGAAIAQNQAITVNFSEPVNVAAGITFTCTAGSLSGLGGTTGSGVTSLNLTYAGALGGTCTLTVPAASVTDVDTIDPPNNPAANFVATFTVDAAPSVTATTPADGATAATNAPITVTFSEAVDISSAADFSLECPSGIAAWLHRDLAADTAGVDRQRHDRAGHRPA